MRNLRGVALVSLLAGLLVAGCAGRPGTGSPSPADPADPAGPDQVATTVTYDRQGGIAGFSDQLIVQPDGSYTFTGRYRSAGTGRLSADELADLWRLLQSAAVAAAPTYSPLRIADGFNHVIRYGDREVRAGDGNIPSPLEPVVELLGGILQRHGA